MRRTRHLSKQTAQQVVGVFVVILFATLGVYLLQRSHAASPYAAVDADKGSLVNGAQSVPDPSASDGNAVQFGQRSITKILGMNSAYSSADLADLTSLHASSVRTDFELNSTDNGFINPPYTNTNTAQWFTETSTAKVFVLPLLNSYAALSTITSSAWSSAVVSWCQTYCAGGTFWAGNPNAAYAPTTLELFNEPYGNWYRGGSVQPADYARLLIASRSALDNAGLHNIAILAAAGSYNGGGGFDSTVQADGGYAAVQGVVVHPYGSISLPITAGSYSGWSQVYTVHAALNMPMYVTEDGWCTPDGIACAGGDITEAQKDANIALAISQLNSVPWIAGFWYFNLHSFISGTTTITTGLRDLQGNATPAWTAFQQAAIQNGF